MRRDGAVGERRDKWSTGAYSDCTGVYWEGNEFQDGACDYSVIIKRE